MKIVKALFFFILALAATAYAFWLRDLGEQGWPIPIGFAAVFLIVGLKAGFMSDHE
jgi:hypothetical protein